MIELVGDVVCCCKYFLIDSKVRLCHEEGTDLVGAEDHRRRTAMTDQFGGQKEACTESIGDHGQQKEKVLE
jgi:hypothetical protein